MVSLASCSFLTETRSQPLPEHFSSQNAAKMLELNETTNFIMLSQVLSRSSFAARLGLPTPTKTGDLNAVLQIEDCLNRLEKSHALLLLTNAAQMDNDDLSSGQRFLFQVRYAVVPLHLK